MIIDIIFQHGEFYNTNIGTWIDTFVKFILPILTLIGGFFLNLVYQNYNETKRLKDFKFELYFDFTSLFEPLAQQSREFIEFSKKISSEYNREFFINIFHNLVNVEDRFKKYSSSDLAKITIIKNNENSSNDNLKQIHNLFESIRLIDKIMSVVENEKKSIVDEINRSRKIINDSIHEIGKIVMDYVVQINQGTTQDPFILEVIKEYQNHSLTAKDYNLYFGKKSLIIPLAGIVDKYSHENKEAVRLLPLIWNCTQSYKKIEETVNSISIMYKDYGEELLRNKELIERIIKNIKNTI